MSYFFENVTEDTKLIVWAKGIPIKDYDPTEWRRDTCGRAMRYQDHGNTSSEYGWEIDHIFPRALGGKTEFGNLQPLQWKHNRTKADTYPWFCSML